MATNTEILKIFLGRWRDEQVASVENYFENKNERVRVQGKSQKIILVMLYMKDIFKLFWTSPFSSFHLITLNLKAFPWKVANED